MAPETEERNSRPPHNPHDHLFKVAFGPPANARDFFSSSLGGALGEAIREAELEALPGDFIDPGLEEQRCDLLFRACWAGDDAEIYLQAIFDFEHQRTSPRMMGARFDGYRAAAWRRILNANPDTRWLPPFVGVVLYNGARPWSAPTQVADLIKMPENPALAAELAAMQPAYRYRVIDLPAMDPDSIKGSLVTRATQSLMRAVGLGQAKEWLMRYGAMLAEILAQPDLGDLFRALVKYMLGTESGLNRNEIRRVVLASPAKIAETAVMTIAEQLHEEGRLEGMTRVVLALLAKRFGEVPLDLKQKIESLPEREITALVDATFDFSTEGDLRSWLSVR